MPESSTVNGSMGKIRVLIVDDSALVRQMLMQILDGDPEIEVVAVAADPHVAREKIKKHNPDVLTLDVEMPRMDGLTFLGHLMRLRPMPVVMVSSLTEHGAEITLKALELGAVDFVSKPKIDVAHTLTDYAEEIRSKVKVAATAKVLPLQGQRLGVEKHSADAILEPTSGPIRFKSTDKIIAIGASTGGTEAIKAVLAKLPPDTPGIVIAQHIPAYFSKAFAERVNGLSAMNVMEAVDGEQILRGHVYVAPGHSHLVVARDGARYICRLNDGPPVNRHKPSVDVLFRSVAQTAGPNSLGVILTGMGDDGARGLKEMHEAGAATVAQDERTSVVWGMPGSAVKYGGVDKVLALDKIAPWLVRALE